MRYHFIAQHKKAYPVTLMCTVLEVSTTGYYDWATSPTRPRAAANHQLDRAIQRVFTRHKARYGAPRITADLKNDGIRCSENRVARRMRQLWLRACHAKKFKVTTDSLHHKPVAPNLLQQNFGATAPNQKWVSDITYVWTNEGWLYLAVIMDLYSRSIIGWSLQPRMTQQLIGDALTMALFRRGFPKDVILHSDRGSQYCSTRYQRLLRRNQLICSMSRTGCCYDNAAMESFFHSLKIELIHRERYSTRSQARASVFECIEVYYNRYRRHSAIGHQNPMAYEAAHAA
jgi:transposase InsO family protein